MASRRSDSNRTPRTPVRTTAPTSTSAQTPASVPAPTYATTPAPAHTAGTAPAKTPPKSPVKKAAKAAPHRARKAKADQPPLGSSVSSSAVSGDLRRTMIAEAAYFHAERRGFMPGGEMGDWLVAESEIDALLKTVSGRPQ